MKERFWPVHVRGYSSRV
jgi:NADH dehydrogenase (ubiquinone) 1 alpha subcomplex subunit 9